MKFMFSVFPFPFFKCIYVANQTNLQPDPFTQEPARLSFYGLRFPGCFKDLDVKIEIMTKFMLLTVKNLLWKKTSTTYSYY